MFGPGKAKDYMKKLNKNMAQPIPPLKQLGPTIETLLQEGVLFTDKQYQQLHPGQSLVKGWTLPDFWEQTTWPRDSNGINVRFGLPVVDEDEDELEDEEEEDYMVSAPPLRRTQKQYMETAPPMDADNDSGLSEDPESPPNPYVQNVVGVRGLQREIVDTKRDGVVFLSARW